MVIQSRKGHLYPMKLTILLTVKCCKLKGENYLSIELYDILSTSLVLKSFPKDNPTFLSSPVRYDVLYVQTHPQLSKLQCGIYGTVHGCQMEHLKHVTTSSSSSSLGNVCNHLQTQHHRNLSGNQNNLYILQLYSLNSQFYFPLLPMGKLIKLKI